MQRSQGRGVGESWLNVKVRISGTDSPPLGGLPLGRDFRAVGVAANVVPYWKAKRIDEGRNEGVRRRGVPPAPCAIWPQGQQLVGQPYWPESANKST